MSREFLASCGRIVPGRGASLPLHVFVRFEPRPGKQREVRDELILVMEPTNAEAGRICFRLFESTREPLTFFIHSEWTDDDACEVHAELAHTKRVLDAIGELITHPVQAVRTREIC